MQQRRTPGGQRPARRPGQTGRAGGARGARPVREGGVRAEPRATAGRAPARATDGLQAKLSGWEDHDPTSDRFPTELAFSLANGGQVDRLRLHDTTLHLGEFVADVQRFGSGLERWLYRTFTGDPVEYKLFSRASSRGRQLDAWSAHEWIRWGRGR